MAEVGLVLSVLPLCISAIEHYEDLLRPLRRYRSFASKAQRFCEEIEAERVIFSAECQLLLGTVTGRETASQMIENVDHVLWQDSVLKDKLTRQLGSLGSACASTICKINAKLDEISLRAGQLCPYLSTTNVVGCDPGFVEMMHQNMSLIAAFGFHDWVRIRTKLKFAFSEAILQDHVNELRDLNRTLLTISGQIIRLDNEASTRPHRPRHSNWTTKGTEDVKRFGTVQTASQLLYKALGQACRAHSEHFAVLCLEAVCETCATDLNSDVIEFSLAFSSTAVAITPTEYAESSCQDTRISLKLDGLYWVKVMSAVSNQQSTSLTESTTCGKPGSQETLSTHIHNDFCDKLKAWPKQSLKVTSNLCIGCIEPKNLGKHTVYQTSEHPSMQVQPLPRFLHTGSPTSSLARFTLLQQLDLAHKFAVSVLQLNGTGWLAPDWSSSTVLLQTEQSETQLQRPHILARICAAADIRPLHSPATLSPNPYLFSLSIMLLELAYDAPFSALLSPSDLETSSDVRLAHFAAALRLTESVGTVLGAAFADVVRRCLRCDFGHGSDLGSVKLQEKVYEDVVCRLEELKEGLMRLLDSRTD